jgi:hypothetical protein
MADEASGRARPVVAPGPPDAVPDSQVLRQAVVFIHGVGDQSPGSSVRGFIRGVLGAGVRFERGKPAPYISSPDRFDETFELRRLHLWSDPATGRPGTDFFELYWADLMPSISTGEVFGWLKGLARRPLKDMPAQLRPLWLLSRSIVLLALAAAAVVATVLGWRMTSTAVGRVLSLAPVALFLGFLRGAVGGFLRSSLGDAARYLSPRPANVAARQAIRGRGLTLLSQMETKYDRIVVVGHSLGSVIAYDVLGRLWADYMWAYRESTAPLKAQAALDEMERAYGHGGGIDADAYQAAQWALWQEMRQAGHRWVITDLVTLGSPLTHAQLLMASSRSDLEERQLQRELPTCPPAPDAGRPGQTSPPPNPFSFTEQRSPGRRILHHGAVFALVRWTNLYFPVRWGVFGDPVGGPLAGVFGTGIADHPVGSDLGFVRTRTPKSHSCYWTPGRSAPPTPDDARTTLVGALRLDGQAPRREADDEEAPAAQASA